MKVIDKIKKEINEVQAATGTTGNDHVRAVLMTGVTIGLTTAVLGNSSKLDVIKAVEWLETQLRGLDTGDNDGRVH